MTQLQHLRFAYMTNFHYSHLIMPADSHPNKSSSPRYMLWLLLKLEDKSRASGKRVRVAMLYQFLKIAVSRIWKAQYNNSLREEDCILLVTHLVKLVIQVSYEMWTATRSDIIFSLTKMRHSTYISIRERCISAASKNRLQEYSHWFDKYVSVL